ncbi:hypothetical protein N2603_38305 [Bradyrhizobium huanghuaihaiense]|uniref:hypothetical protein n=1 Tax=Bradyrhizobium huanghuaihaiense TaxID=990078 RepID=UPI0021AA468C|nr:hypothetical protein [Bradyrhizobium sp. CB3035]UWU75774.1 hypothetical protein N2603_38305 [Bradyrhizobium sp. CB3035]
MDFVHPDELNAIVGERLDACVSDPNTRTKPSQGLSVGDVSQPVLLSAKIAFSETDRDDGLNLVEVRDEPALTNDVNLQRVIHGNILCG